MLIQQFLTLYKGYRSYRLPQPLEIDALVVINIIIALTLCIVIVINVSVGLFCLLNRLRCPQPAQVRLPINTEWLLNSIFYLDRRYPIYKLYQAQINISCAFSLPGADIALVCC